MEAFRRTFRSAIATAAAALLALASGCAGGSSASVAGTPSAISAERPLVADRSTPEARRLAEAAMAQVGRTVSYDAAYVRLDYPGGDVPISTGVCTDVVIRAFRDLGVDLQVEVHEDMTRAFDGYPQRWGLDGPDPNIDHRRVPNLQAFFARRGVRVPVSRRGEDYRPGDIVTWDVYGRPHAGVISTERAPDGGRFRVAHNIGRGVQVEDMLFAYPVTGHYRWYR